MTEASTDLKKKNSDSDGKKTPKYFHDTTHPDGQCGWGPSCSPSWLQCLRWPPFVVAYLWFICCPVYMTSSYFGAILPSIERRFGLSSSQSLLLASLSKLSATVFVVFTTYYAERTSRPKIFALSFVLMALGNLCTALPHFLSEPLNTDALLAGQISTGGASSYSQNLCVTNDVSESNSTDTSCTAEPVGFRGLIWWAVLGQIIQGIGEAAVYPIAVPYLDDLAGRYKRRFVIYFTFYSTIFVGGPACGYFLGSIASEYYVDFERIPEDKLPVGLSQWDPRWIGAWWVGFVIVGFFLLFAALPMTLLPRDPSVNVGVRDGDKCESDGDTDTKAKTKVKIANGEASKTKDTLWADAKGFMPVVKRILRRPVLVFYMMFLTVELACIGVFTTFVVKYFILQFDISGKRASFLNGAVLIPAAVLGLNTSAFVCRRFRLTLKQCAIYLVINNVLTVVLLIIATFVGCQNQPIAGVNTEYRPADYSLASTDCNNNCDCNSNIFRPVCGTDDVSYLSPCQAGCQAQKYSNNTWSSVSYSNCSCIQAPSSSEFDIDSEFDSSAKSGLCERDASCETNLYLAVFLFGLLTFCRFQDNTPTTLIALGNCETDMRTTAFGISKFIQNIFGFFPTPIYFGAIVNTTCSLWQYTCGERGSCWLYDIVKLRYAFFGLNIALRFLQILTCIGMTLTVKEFVTEKTIESPSDGTHHDVNKNSTKEPFEMDGVDSQQI